jgi:hypothetical protein
VKEISGTGSRLENETLVLYNEAEDIAIVNTASPTIYRRLTRLGYVPQRVTQHRARFLVPKRDIRLPRPPRKARPMSEAQSRALQEARFLSRSPAFDEVPGKTKPDPAPDTDGALASPKKEVFA